MKSAEFFISWAANIGLCIAESILY